eukprot:gene7203-7417_t
MGLKYPKNVSVAATTRKIGNNPQRSSVIELNLERICNDSSSLPPRQVGPVEIATLPGRGRGVVAKDNIAPGNLLFVSEPVGPVLKAPAGLQLAHPHLLQHWQSVKGGLTPVDRYKLSLLHCSTASHAQLPLISFKDFSSSKAASKAQKASAKGFGKPAAASPPPAASTQLSEQRLFDISRQNAFGDDHLDGALTYLRQEQQQSIIGIWPEFCLLNHSCAPNTAGPVLLSDRLLLRAAVPVPEGEELTTSYLGLAGGIPRPQRQQLLQDNYGFVCSCHRCTAEAKAPEQVLNTLQEMHQWVTSQLDTPQLLQLMLQDDAGPIQALHDRASALVQQLEVQLQQVAEPVVVFAPASEPHLLLLADSAIRASDAAAANLAPAASADLQKLRVQQLVRAVVLRYGEVGDMEMLTQLTGAVSASLSPHWLGLTDLNGQMGLQQLLDAAAAVAKDKITDADGKQKVEVTAQQLSDVFEHKAATK